MPDLEAHQAGYRKALDDTIRSLQEHANIHRTNGDTVLADGYDRASGYVAAARWIGTEDTTSDPQAGQSEGTASGTGSTLPAEQTPEAAQDTEPAEERTEPLPPPCGTTWEFGECAEGGLHTCALIGGHRTHRCVCGGFIADADIEPGKPDDTEALLAEFTTTWLTATTDDERTEALEDLLDAWYTEWPDTAVTTPHWPIADALVRMLGPWEADKNTTLTPPKRTIHRLRHDLATARIQRDTAYRERDEAHANAVSIRVQLDQTEATLRDRLAAAEANYQREATNAEQLRQHFDKTIDERDTWKYNAGIWENNRNGWHRRALEAEAERDSWKRSLDAAIADAVVDQAQLREAIRTRTDQLDGMVKLAEQRADTIASMLAQINAQNAMTEQLANERNEARRVRDREQRAAWHLRNRVAALTSEQPTSADYHAAEMAILDAYPHFWGDSFVDQVAIIAVDAAWKLNRAPRTEDTEPAHAPKLATKAGTDG